MQDRSALVARIERAASEGRISPADREIRIRNVRAAGSPTELELIARDLDLLEAAVPSSAGATGAAP
ncbi:MAG: DUF1707 domain-containing protein, partial [Marmoricola sp.]